MSLRNFTNLNLTFSSAKNFILLESLKHNNSLVSDSLCSEIQCSFDMCLGERRIVFQDFLNCFSSFEHLQNLPDHDSGVFEGGGSTTDLSVCDNILIDFNSHAIKGYNTLFKDFELMPVTQVYNSYNDKDIYFLDSNGEQIKVSSITKEYYKGKIYDVDVENDVVLVRRKPSLLEKENLWEEKTINAFWSGNSNGLVLDSSGNGNDGSCVAGTSCPALTAGIDNGAYDFDGSNDAILTSLNIDQSTGKTLTMCAWAYPATSTTSDRDVISTDNGGYDWAIDKSGGFWRVATGNNYWNTGMAVSVNAWQHLCAVFDTNNVIFYRNVIPVSLGTAPGYDTSDSNLAVGRNSFLSGVF